MEIIYKLLKKLFFKKQRREYYEYEKQILELEKDFDIKLYLMSFEAPLERREEWHQLSRMWRPNYDKNTSHLRESNETIKK